MPYFHPAGNFLGSVRSHYAGRGLCKLARLAATFALLVWQVSRAGRPGRPGRRHVACSLGDPPAWQLLLREVRNAFWVTVASWNKKKRFMKNRCMADNDYGIWHECEQRSRWEMNRKMWIKIYIPQISNFYFVPLLYRLRIFPIHSTIKIFRYSSSPYLLLSFHNEYVGTK